MMLVNPYVLAVAGGGEGGGGTDPLWSDVLLLLHGDATPIVDSGPGAISLILSGVESSTAVSGYAGAGQMRVETGEYLVAPGLRMTTDGTWTIEGWATFVAFGSPRSHLFGSWTPETGWTLDITSSGELAFLALNGSGASQGGAGASIGTGSRHHIALVIALTSTTLAATLYLDGSEIATYSGGAVGSFGSTSSAYDFRIGSRSDSTLTQDVYWDEFRVTAGARYTEGFTPPSGSLPHGE